MKLQQQQRQTQTMAHQLQQSVELLYLPIMEVRAKIQEEMQQNPLIEQVTAPAELRLEENPEPVKDEKAEPLDFDDKLETLLKHEDEWLDYFMQGQENASTDDVEKFQHTYDSIPESPLTLQEHLLEQLHLLDLPTADADVVELLIGDIDENGYFRGSFPDLQMTTGHSAAELEHFLKLVQTFDPPGVGARTPQECLLLQLDSSETLARDILEHHFEALTESDTAVLAKTLDKSEDEVKHILKTIRSLNPRPGAEFAPRPTPFVTPELDVIEKDGAFGVKTDDDLLPRIRISKQYRDMLTDDRIKASDKEYIREKLNAGNALIHSLTYRQNTIRKVVQVIVDAQAAFLRGGQLVPMTFNEAAKKAGVHETTVGRIVHGKYIKTPHGTLELKKFFVRGIHKSDGSVLPTSSVQEQIRQIIQRESKLAPFSDQAIAQMLELKGIKIARRTVAKYRDALGIPPQGERQVRQ